MSYQGSCLCKAIQYSIEGPIDSIIHCHCSLCRKSSGSAYATNGYVQTDDFIINKGQDNLTSFAFKPGRYRHFCTTCGSPIYSSNDDDPSRIRIRAGLIQSDIQERPVAHIFVASKANWDATGDNKADETIPSYAQFEPGRQ